VSLSLPTTPDGWVARDPSILLDRNTCATPAEATSLERASTSTRDKFGKFFVPSWLSSHAPWLQHSLAEEEIKKQQWEEWIEANKNLANQVQWIEPLLVSVFGSSDMDAVCDGSFRTMRTGWGVPGTTDVRNFAEAGVGRYVKNNFDWMFPKDTEAMPSAYRQQLSGCMGDGMGADIRTKINVYEHHWPADVPLPPMEVGRGIEIRIFDNFPIETMPHVYRMISLVAEVGRTFTAPGYIYNNIDWADAIQSVMREGWNAVLPEGYVRDLATALNLHPTFVEGLENFQSFHVFSELYKVMFEAHSKGMWTTLLLDDIPEQLPLIENPNRHSWELGAIIQKGFTTQKVVETLGLDQLVDSVGGLERGFSRTVNVSELQLSDDSCSEDFDDVIYLAERF